MASSSNTAGRLAHPPRSNPSLRSSSGAAVSLHHSIDGDLRGGRQFHGFVPSLVVVFLSFDRTEARISSVERGSVLRRTPTNRAQGARPSSSEAQGDNACGLLGTSGTTCCLHPPMTDSHTRRIGSRGPVSSPPRPIGTSGHVRAGDAAVQRHAHLQQNLAHSVLLSAGGSCHIPMLATVGARPPCRFLPTCCPASG